MEMAKFYNKVQKLQSYLPYAWPHHPARATFHNHSGKPGDPSPNEGTPQHRRRQQMFFLGGAHLALPAPPSPHRGKVEPTPSASQSCPTTGHKKATAGSREKRAGFDNQSRSTPVSVFVRCSQVLLKKKSLKWSLNISS
ncbi:hypothetical protein JTE90_003612 [Oedothorax gibbosus]|uniref:Uncharacterized protein n=1 Tax=Oedothorax gibbosus TaxID=931172 RepID=A0AAV6VE73_9ARAC|nr:hypothetical protein JTE90_003612 [Oedothorax gibbosus]